MMARNDPDSPNAQNSCHDGQRKALKMMLTVKQLRIFGAVALMIITVGQLGHYYSSAWFPYLTEDPHIQDDRLQLVTTVTQHTFERGIYLLETLRDSNFGVSVYGINLRRDQMRKFQDFGFGEFVNVGELFFDTDYHPNEWFGLLAQSEDDEFSGDVVAHIHLNDLHPKWYHLWQFLSISHSLDRHQYVAFVDVLFNIKTANFQQLEEYVISSGHYFVNLVLNNSFNEHNHGECSLSLQGYSHGGKADEQILKPLVKCGLEKACYDALWNNSLRHSILPKTGNNTEFGCSEEQRYVDEVGVFLESIDDEEEKKRNAEEEAKRKAEEEAKRKAEEEEAKRKAEEEEAKRKAEEEEAKRKAEEEEAKRKAEEEEAKRKAETPEERARRETIEKEDAENAKRRAEDMEARKHAESLSNARYPDTIEVKQELDGSITGFVGTKADKKDVIALLIPSITRGPTGIGNLPVFTILLQSLIATAPPPQEKFRFVLYVGYDDGDPTYDSAEAQTAVRAHAEGMMAPYDFQYRSQRLMGVKGAPCWVWNALSVQAYEEGADYMYQLNDDIRMATGGWAAAFTDTLKANPRMANFGMTGPMDSGNDRTLTQSFVHRTHIEIFGRYYPAVFKNWFSDDWAGHVYRADSTFVQRNIIVTNVNPGGTRYLPAYDAVRFLSEELEISCNIIGEWLKSKNNHGWTCEKEYYWWEH